MASRTVAEQLDFVVAAKGQAEAEILAEALRVGVGLLYEESLIEAFLRGRVTRGKLLQELGEDRVESLEAQRQAIDRDFAWGTSGR